MKPITLVLADDHRLVRQGLRAIFDMDPQFAVVGESEDGLETVRMVERLKPDVLIQDWSMPHLNGADVIREVKRIAPDTRIIILSMYTNEVYVVEALRNGALGYLLKSSSASEVKQAIREVFKNRRYLGAPLSERAIQAYILKSQPIPVDPYDALTARERDVFHLICEGFTNSDIAKKLTLSVRTVEMHRGSLMHKLDLRTPVDIVRFAIKHNILPIEE